MNVQELARKRESILSVFNQSRNDLIALNAEIEKTVDENLQEFERIRAENESLLELRNSNRKALNFFDKIFK